MNIEDRLQRSLIISLKQALPKSRGIIAEEMAYSLGQEISIHQINAYVCPTKLGYRLPVAFLPAWCRATGSNEPLKVIADAVGLFTIPAPDALLLEIAQDEERIKAMQAERTKKLALVAALKGGR